MSTTAAEPLDPALIEHLLDSIVEAIPAGANDTEQTRAIRRNAARLALLALKPTDAFQAMLAAQAVAAHYAVMDAYRLAAQPDLAPAMTARMRSNAATLSRTMQATLRTLHKHQAPPAEAKAQPSPRSPAQSRPAKPAPRPLLPPLPAPTEPLPRIRLWDEMTMQERRETYGYKGDPKFNPTNGGK
jgi:hypothetical protein